MYGSTTSGDQAAPNSIIRIDLVTGEGTVVGPTGEANGVADIAFDANGQLWGWSEDNDFFVSIDKSTGAATHIGSSVNSSGDGMSFDSGGTLYAMITGDGGTLDTVDPATGSVTTGPSLTGSPYGNRSIPAASFNCTGTTLWALDGLANFGGIQPLVNLVTVDTTTGAITDHGQTVNRMDGLAWYCFRAAPPSNGGGASPLPVVTSISPTSGPVGTIVGITGDRFESATQVLFGNTPASFDIDGYQHITAIAPPGTGTVDVRVVNPNGTSPTTAADQFTYTPTPLPPGGGPGAPGAGPTCPKVSQLRRRTIRGARRYMNRDGCNVPLRVGRRVPLKPGHRRRVVSQRPAPGTATSGPVTINMGYID
jgi:hypothetical protein